MEKVKKNWPIIAGVTVVAVVVGLIINHEMNRETVKDKKLRLKEEKKIEEERKEFELELKRRESKRLEVDKLKKLMKWPMPRGIIDPAQSVEQQKKQLEKWMTTELNAHFEAKEKMKEPAFRRTASGTLHT